jgi:hypothetical protein
MKKTTTKIILDTSDEAAKIVTLTGWQSSDGRFWGKDERAARYSGCTHKQCECGGLMERHWLKCAECRHKAHAERFNALPFKEWNGEPVCTWDAQKYFFDEDDLIEYCEDNELTEVDLLFCVENNWRQVDDDYWSDYMPEDSDGDFPKQMQEALDNLNKIIQTLPAQSYSAGKVRTKYILKNEHEG